MSSSTEGSAVPPSAKGSWSSFLKSLASFNGDMSSMTAPPFILSTTSLTEFSSYWAEHPPVFVAPTQEPDPARRALLVLKWFLTTLKQQYSSRSEKLGSEKKPLNPFLGELFIGRWEDDVGKTELVSEQVSHHPPVTAYHIHNATHQIQLQGYNGQKASFSLSKGRIDIRQVGHAILTLTPPDSSTPETYLITLPSLHIEGLWSGAPFVELNKTSHIASTSGFTAKIDYSGRGWLSGKKNSFTATLAPTGKEKNPVYTVDGQWTGSFTIHDSAKKVIDTWKAAEHPTSPFKISPIDQQDPLESRRAWRKVAEAQTAGDMSRLGAEKGVIEERQRELRKKEKDEGRSWERVFFSSQRGGDPVFDALGVRVLGESLEADKTDGVWRWDEQKAREAKSPFRPGVMPEG